MVCMVCWVRGVLGAHNGKIGWVAPVYLDSSIDTCLLRRSLRSPDHTFCSLQCGFAEFRNGCRVVNQLGCVMEIVNKFIKTFIVKNKLSSVSFSYIKMLDDKTLGLGICRKCNHYCIGWYGVSFYLPRFLVWSDPSSLELTFNKPSRILRENEEIRDSIPCSSFDALHRNVSIIFFIKMFG